MVQPGSLTSNRTDASPGTADAAWAIALEAARLADDLDAAGDPAAFRLASAAGSAHPHLDETDAGAADAALVWHPADGWQHLLPSSDERAVWLDLYLPVCSATRTRPVVVGHLGQSIDGFIATHSGDSQFVTGQENIRHLHRMRALSDAIVVGAGTIAADDPLLTTRHVAGPNPVRVVFDPGRRLEPHYKVFTDAAADTLYVCAQSLVAEGETHVGRALIVPARDTADSVEVTEVLGLLRGRGCRRIFVEGGGVTVSSFVEAGLLDRLQVAIAPLIIGDGRPAIRLPAPAALSECVRPAYRVFRMGGDVFFDCELKPRSVHPASPTSDIASSIERVI